MQIYTIYLATNTVNGKCYVGFDSKWPRRKAAHKHEALNAKSATHRTKFHNAIRKHGFESFEWNPIYQSADGDHTLKEMERHFIVEHDTFDNGYNLTLGGEGPLGCTRSEETRNKMSLARGGKHLSTETRNKMSLAKKGILNKRSRQISTPYGIFDSIEIAATALNFYPGTVKYRLERVSFPDWFYIQKVL